MESRIRNAGILAAALLIAAAGVACTKTASKTKAPKQIATAVIEPIGANTVRGTFKAWEDKTGAVAVEVAVNGLTPGKHGSHIHSGGSCGDGGKAAGPHWDPHSTGRHGQPSDPSTAHHAADMPNIDVDAKGNGGMTFATANFKLADLSGKTIIVHENTDNYTDTPANGGSGARIGCGVIQVTEQK